MEHRCTDFFAMIDDILARTRVQPVSIYSDDDPLKRDIAFASDTDRWAIQLTRLRESLFSEDPRAAVYRSYVPNVRGRALLATMLGEGREPTEALARPLTG